MSGGVDIDGRLPPGRAALVVAHPGHELRVHGWLERARPLVFVLTDGSGHGKQSRLASSTHVLERVGAQTGAIYGRFSDAVIYTAMLDRQVSLFTRVAEELASAFVAERTAYVVADAAEGYNPTHDICRHLVDAAIAMARTTPADIASFEFDLIGRPDTGNERGHRPSVLLDLDDGALERKLQAAREYPEMAGEVDSALNRFGAAAFRRECFRAVTPEDHWREPAELPPYYERHGERRVAERVYRRVIRYHDHVRPLRDTLLRHAGTAFV